MKKNIIVVSSHPDDEVLGAGGTLLKHKKKRDNIYWLVITNILREENKEIYDNRQIEINRIDSAFGFKDKFLLNFPTSSLNSGSLQKLIPEISKIFNKVKPEIVYTPNRSDAHSDHRITFDAVMACSKSFRYSFIKKILMYECLSETEFSPALIERVFLPNYFVDISEYLDKKIELMKIYKSEIGDHPFPRSEKNIKALATFRGAIAGVKYAESFQLLKFID